MLAPLKVIVQNPPWQPLRRCQVAYSLIRSGSVTLTPELGGDVKPLLQICAIACDDLLIPCKAVLGDAAVGSLPGLVPVHIDDTIAFVHLDGPAGYDIQDPPHGVADQINSVSDGLAHLGDMLPQILDAVIIVNLPVLRGPVPGAETIFCNEQGKVVAVIHLV